MTLSNSLALRIYQYLVTTSSMTTSSGGARVLEGGSIDTTEQDLQTVTGEYDSDGGGGSQHNGARNLS
ncbi:hypothetical protein YC2023_053654 [Brassica napus]